MLVPDIQAVWQPEDHLGCQSNDHGHSYTLNLEDNLLKKQRTDVANNEENWIRHKGSHKDTLLN